MLGDFVKNRVDVKKPRKEGRTYTVDKLQGLDSENFQILAPFIDVVKIYNVLPLLMSDSVLEKKIKFYHDFDIKVSTGSSISEYMYLESAFDKFVTASAKAGFDIVELGENSFDLSMDQKKKVTDIVLSKDLEFQWKVGKKDPRHQPGPETILEKIEEGVKLGSDKIVLESNEGIGVGIYDEKGLVKWNLVGALTSKYPPSTFIFEAPMETQQASLLAEFGQRVNLAEIRVDAVASVETQRRGFPSKASFTVSYTRKDPEGGPATKFIYFIIKTKHPIEQAELMELTRLPRRTVQAAIEELKAQGLIIERNSLDDARKRVYQPIQSEWI